MKYFIVLSLLSSIAIADRKPLWVYTSVYKEFITPIEEAFEKANPDIDVMVFQAGSEKIQSKLEAEFMAGKPQADVVMTSDPFWSQDLVKRGLAYAPEKKEPAPTNYFSVMVMIAHKDFETAKRPKSFKDLTKPEFKDLIQMGSPLESGTMFSTVAHLNKKYGWDFFTKLRGNNIAASGGNSTVIQKVENGEKKVGIVLLENALAAKKRGSPIEVIYPDDGGVIIPSVQVIMKTSRQIPAAEKFGDFILGEKGQNFLRSGYMYSIRKDVQAPEGAISFSDLKKKSALWEKSFVDEVSGQSKEIKRKFSAIVLR